MQELVEYLSGLVATGALALLGAGLRWVLLRVKAEHRAVLHQAIRTGVLAAIGRGLSGDAAARHAAEYAKASSPKTVGKMGATDGLLHEIARSKIAEVKK
jgi:uncharacterized protein YciI